MRSLVFSLFTKTTMMSFELEVVKVTVPELALVKDPVAEPSTARVFEAGAQLVMVTGT